jgi:hypothetical protein
VIEIAETLIQSSFQGFCGKTAKMLARRGFQGFSGLLPNNSFHFSHRLTQDYLGYSDSYVDDLPQYILARA